jgi:hypothetical protein
VTYEEGRIDPVNTHKSITRSLVDHRLFLRDIGTSFEGTVKPGLAHRAASLLIESLASILISLSERLL